MIKWFASKEINPNTLQDYIEKVSEIRQFNREKKIQDSDPTNLRDSLVKNKMSFYLEKFKK